MNRVFTGKLLIIILFFNVLSIDVKIIVIISIIFDNDPCA